MEINCNTKVIPDLNTPYKEAAHRGVITDGLSEEALFYINQATARTQEDNYNIFDENGLMPDSYDYFNNLLESDVLLVCDYGENGEIYTADERFLIERNEDNTRTVYYDSDGINGYDRTATYQDTPIGNRKIEETFDADGDGTNEVEIKREIATEKDRIYRESIEDNPEYRWYDNILNIFGYGRTKQVRYYWFDEPYVLKSSSVEMGVNADDMGYDEIGGNHFEYEERVVTYPNRETEKKHQAYYKWRYADEYDYDVRFK